MHQSNKSHFTLSNTLISDDAGIIFIDDTIPNSPNESQKNRKTLSFSYISERNQKQNDSNVSVKREIYKMSQQ